MLQIDLISKIQQKIKEGSHSYKSKGLAPLEENTIVTTETNVSKESKNTEIILGLTLCLKFQ